MNILVATTLLCLTDNPEVWMSDKESRQEIIYYIVKQMPELGRRIIKSNWHDPVLAELPATQQTKTRQGKLFWLTCIYRGINSEFKERVMVVHLHFLIDKDEVIAHERASGGYSTVKKFRLTHGGRPEPTLPR